MATYKEIKGTQIEVVSSDPSNPVEGQVWYNSTDQAVKGETLTGAGAWATGNNLNNGRFYFQGAGTQTSTIVFGGEQNPGGVQAYAETYNGTNWTEVGDLNSGRWGLGGLGTSSTTALAMGGAAPASDIAKTESWDGSSWTEVNDLNQGRS